MQKLVWQVIIKNNPFGFFVHAGPKKPSLEVYFQYILKNIKYILKTVQTMMLNLFEMFAYRGNRKGGQQKISCMSDCFQNIILIGKVKNEEKI